MKRVPSIIAILPPFIAVILQLYFWNFIQPLTWFLFYPAVFLSAWMGGVWYGLASTFLSILLGFSFFVNPNFPISSIHTKEFITFGVFFIMGIFFSTLLGKLKDSNTLLSLELQETRVHQNQEKKSLENKFHAITDNSLDIINLYDENFNLLYLSPSFERVTGFTSKERLELTYLHFIHKDDLENSKRIMQEVISNPRISISYQNRFLHKQGHYIWIEGAIINLLQDKDINAIISNFRDITERKKVESLIQDLNNELEIRVMERTKELLELNKELEAFSYSVSHDLRAPLRAINGYTNMLIEDYESILDSEGKRICKVISSEATRMGKLIDDLLSFSRLNRTTLQYLRIDMKAMAQRVYEELIEKESKSQIEFRLGELPNAFSDPILIRQVWFNLLSNAIKFSSKKENPVIEVRGKEVEKEIIYSVIDNGAGFDMSYSDKLFGVFQRLHSESEFEGTGVGLAIIKRAITRNGGRVWAEGIVNEGAKMYFTLPIKEDKNG